MKEQMESRYVLCTALYFGAVGIICTFYYPFLQQKIGMNLSQISKITAFGALFSLVAQPFLGWYYTKSRNKKKYIIAYLTGFLLLFTLFFFGSKKIMGIVAIVYGCLAIPMIGMYEIYIESIAEYCTFSYARIRKWGSVGMGAITLLGGSLILLFGFQGLHMIGMILLTVCGILIWNDFIVLPGVQQHEKTERFLSVFSCGNVNVLYILCFLGLGSYIGCEFAFSTYLTKLCQNAVYANQVFSISTGLKIFMEFLVFSLIGTRVVKWNTKKTLLIVFALISIRFLLISSEVIGLVIIGDMMHSVIFPLFLTIIFRYLRMLVPDRMVPGCYSIVSVLIFGVSNLIYPMIFSMVAMDKGYSSMYRLTALLAVLCVAIGGIMLPDCTKIPK